MAEIEIKDTFGSDEVVADNFGYRESEEEIIPDNALTEMAGYYSLLTNENKGTLLQEFEQAEYEFKGGDLTKFSNLESTIEGDIQIAERDFLTNEVIPAPDMTPEMKMAVVHETELSRTVDIPGETWINESLDYIDSAKTEEEKERRFNLFNAAQSSYNILKENNEIAGELLQEIAPTLKQIGAGLAMDFIPTAAVAEHHTPIIKSLYEVYKKHNGSANLKDFFITGNAIAASRDLLWSLPETEKSAYMKDVSAILKKNAGVFGYNEWTHFTTMVQVLSETPKGADWDRILENTAAVFDATMIAGILGTFTLLGRALFKANTVARILAKANPTKFAQAVGEIAVGGKNGARVSKALGMDATDVLIAGSPKVKGQIPKNNVDILRFAENRIRAEEILGQLQDQGSLYHKQERLDSILIKQSKLEDEGLNISHSKPVLTPKRDGVEVEGWWGANAERGFANKQSARASAAAKHFPDAELKEVNGEWFVKYNTFHPYDLDDVGFINSSDILFKGKMAKYISDDTSKIVNEITTKWIIASDKEAFISSELTKALKPLRKLRSNDSKKRVADWLESGNSFDNSDGTVGRVFTREELLNKFPSNTSNTKTNISNAQKEREIKAYFAFRDTEDLVYLINNQRLKDRYIAEGMKQISHGKYTTMARPITKKQLASVVKKGKTTKGEVVERVGIGEDGRKVDATTGELAKVFDEGKVNIYDPFTDNVIQKSANELQDFYTEGGRVAKYKFQEVHGGKTVDYVLVGGKGKIEDLPHHVLNYREGYITRNYVERWFIKTKGTTKISVLDTAPSEMAGNKLIKKYEELYPGTKFEVAQDQGLLRGIQDTSKIDELMDGSGRLFFSHRKDRPLGDFGEAKTLDPIESITHAIGTVSRGAAWEQTIKKSKRNFINTWGDLTGGVWPRNVDEIVSEKSITDPRVLDAQAYFDHVNMLETTQDTFAPYWKTWMQRFSKWMERKSPSKLTTPVARQIDLLGDISPFGALKSITFMRLLAGFPSRQLVLQSTQPLILSLLEPKYMVGKFWGHKLLIDGGTLLINDPKKLKMWTEGFAKTSSMTAAEAEKLVKTFWRTGIAQAVESGSTHRAGMVKDYSHAITNSLGAKLKKTAQNLFVFPLRVGGIGFNVGEYNNVSSNFLIALRRMERSSGKTLSKILDNPKLVDEVHANARRIGFNMTTSGQFAWQKGLLSLPMQFQAISYKTLLAVLGKNQALQGTDHAKLLTSLVMLYGAEGVGLGKGTLLADKAWATFTGDDGAVMPPWVETAISGGLTNFAPYFFWNEGLDIAGSFSPGGGTFQIGEMAIDLFSGRRNFVEVMGGASYQTSTEGVGFMHTIMSLMNKHEWRDPNTSLELVKELALFYPQFSRYSQGQLAHKTGWWISKNNNPVARATWAEAVAKATIGVNAKSVTDTWSLQFYASKKEKGLRKDADLIYTSILREAQNHMFGSVEKDDYQREMLNILFKNKSAIFEAWPKEEDRDFMWNYVVQRMVDEYKLKKGMAWLIQKDGVLGNKYASHGEFVGAIGERIENASKGREDASLGRKFWEWASPEFSKLFTKEEQ